MRSSVTLECPGTRNNFTVLVSTAWQSKFGIGNPKNIRECELFLAPLDASDNPIRNGRWNVELKPGESRPWYHPPAGTAKIAAVCSKLCNGTAVLEFDTPVG